MYDYFLGIDVGLKGGVVLLDNNSKIVQYIIPPLKKGTYNIHKLASLISSLQKENMVGVVEQVRT